MPDYVDSSKFKNYDANQIGMLGCEIIKNEEHESEDHTLIEFSCNICEYTARRQQSLKNHILSKHEGLKYNCNQCDYNFISQSSLRRHVDSKHEGVIYHCDQCGYSANERVNLNIHIRIHKGEKYECKQCQFQAAHKKRPREALREHMMYMHNKRKLYCRVCEYTTLKNTILMNTYIQHIKMLDISVKSVNINVRQRVISEDM